MSQAAVQQTPPQVSPKLRRPHFSAEAAEKFRQQNADFYNPQQKQEQPPAAPVVEKPAEDVVLQPATTVDVPPDYRDTLKAVMEPPLFVAPEEAPQQPDPVDYKARNAALEQELAAMREELAAAKRLPDDLRRMREDQELDRILQENANEFGSIDPADAKRLLTPVLKTMRTQVEESSKASETKLQALETELHKQMEQLRENERRAQFNKTRDVVLKAHPDLEQLQKTEAYRQAMSRPVGGNSGILTGQLVAAEFQRGNTDYVINVLNQIKGQTQPDLAMAASVSPSGTQSVPTSATENTGRLSTDQIAQYKFMVQTGQMSRNEFRDVMKKHRESRSRDS